MDSAQFTATPHAAAADPAAPHLHVVHLPNAAPARRKPGDIGAADAAPPSVPQIAPQIVPQIIWAHGWMHTHANLLPLANTCTHGRDNYLLDMPGFGSSGMPPATWGTQDYADHAAAWLRTLPRGRRIWVGHSFGCRVGLQLAARHPDLVDGLFLMAAAGLPRRRTPMEKFTRGCRIAAFKTLKHLHWLGFGAERVRRFFGSADYANAGPLRPVFVSVVNENLSDVAARVACPVHLLYGENDTETPPSMGQDFARLLAQAHLQVLPRFGHLDILTAGGHQAVYALDTFCEEIFGG